MTPFISTYRAYQFLGYASKINIPRLSTLAPIVCIALPIIGLATTSFLINQAGFLDPYVYASYVYDFQQTIDRFGQTYYSTRIAYIFLERAFASLLGVENGYLICRVVVLSCASAAAYAIAQRYYGRATAVFAAAWISFLPWLPRSLLWTHYDGFGTVYLLIALAFVIAPRHRTLCAHAAAGVAYCLATNCNLLLLAIGAAFFPGWLLLNAGRGRRWLAMHALAVAAGFLITHALLSIAYQAHFADGGGSIVQATLQITRSLLQGTGANWFVPFGKFLEERIFIPLIPLVLAATVGVYWWRHYEGIASERRRFGIAVLSYLVSIIALELVLHIIFKIATLSLFYYLVYLLPASLLALIVLVGEWECATKPEKRWRLYVLPLAFIAIWFARPEFPHVAAFASVWPWLVFGAATVAAAAIRPGKAALTATCACTLTLAVYASFPGKYDIRRNTAEALVGRERDVFKGALFLQTFVGRHVPPQRSIGFWYGNTTAHTDLNSVQSMYLWGYTRLAPPTGAALGMPHIDASIRKAIAKKSVVALLGLNDSEVDRGLAALSAAQIPHSEFQRTAFKGEKWGYTIALVDILKTPPQKSSVTVPLSGSSRNDRIRGAEED